MSEYVMTQSAIRAVRYALVAGLVGGFALAALIFGVIFR